MTERDYSQLVKSNIAPIFHVLSNEQQIMQRTDQKAFTMLSILGVFMVFFIIHFLKININWFNVAMVVSYFISAFFAIINLVLVIVPRIKSDKNGEMDIADNPTYFGGISKFKSPIEYANHFENVFNRDGKIFEMFSHQVYALGKINSYKNNALKRAILFFAIAIISELLIIMSMAWARALPYLFPPS